MIKVHCFVSCVCEAIKRDRNADHRPYYFGVWDSDFYVTDNYRLNYHSEFITHQFFRDWYELLYGIKLEEWYRKNESKKENMTRLEQLVKYKPDQRWIMVMLDLAMLPQRENKFHQAPFPHYVMLERTEKEDTWLMLDPDFRWEGELKKTEILEAAASHAVSGGFYFDTENIQVPSVQTVEAYFRTCFKRDHNPFTEGIGRIFKAFSSDNGVLERKELKEALKQIPVLAIRKYAYEHAFAYFWDHMRWEESEFEDWCTEIEKLVKNYSVIQYKAMKFAQTGLRADKEAVEALLDLQHQLEKKIKGALSAAFEQWCTIHTA
ncbi:Petrobactin biosynthesis protein AsbE [Bacillus lacus]|uniref:Petrobactin biosynthesis protein AsbE n=1 Tax=Metabacillus lacus TaxID=1983721 RepID=A0A7X2J0L3_9BACI|nr:DUF6005 family protein [Metabacillus lacus]MRX73246.1 Petrobactin biosynthesis protein AsbE [Metabacillus lacus]